MTNSLENPSSTGSPWIAGLGIYLLSGIVVVSGVVFANANLERQPHVTQNSPGFINSFTCWDGMRYVRIVNDGYSFRQDTYSEAAFFPVYPFLGRCVAQVTGLRAEVALLCVSHVCLIAVFLLLGLYVRQRYGTDAKTLHGRLEWTLLAFAFFPPTLFFRMAYTESLFMLCLMAAMYAMERDWPLPGVAAIVGLTTGVRLVGAALLAPLVLYVWARFRRGRLRIVELAFAPFLGCWGIVAYMIFLHDRFGEPLAFVKAQGAWNRRPAAKLEDYAMGLFSWEPLWAVFDPASPAYWGRYGSEASPLFNIQILNVFCFVFVALLVIVGYWRGFLNGRETLLASLLLGIPYVTHSYQTLMWSEARFASVVFPAYLVLGELASRMPPWISTSILCISAFLIGGYTALFASWHLVF